MPQSRRMDFPRDYAERVILDDGTPVELRLLRPEDRALLQRGFERMSAQSRYARFLAPKSTLTEAELTYLTDLDQDTHFAIGAVRAADGEGLGVARFIRVAGDPARAEVAITVADEAQGKGLGRLLFARLVAAAAERGVARLRLEVLGTNEHMKQLIRAVAPAHTVETAGGVMSIELPVPDVVPTAPTVPPAADENPLYHVFKVAAEHAMGWTAVARRLVSRGEHGDGSSD